MKKLPLLPQQFQKLGLILFFPFLALGLVHLVWEYDVPWLSLHKSTGNVFSKFQNLTDEVAAIGIILGMLFIAFSKEKTEDEAIQFFRLASLQWAVIVNYIILILCIAFVYGTDFFSVMTYNMFTILFIFIVRFRFVLFMYNKAAA